MDNINTRIGQLIDDLGLSKNQFARNIKSSSAMVSKITNQATNFGKDMLEKIITAYPNLNVTWLLTGIGEMWNTNTNASPPADDEIIRQSLSVLANSNLLYLEFHLTDILLNLKLLRESVTGKSFNRTDYEKTQENIAVIIKDLKSQLKSDKVSNKSLLESLVGFDEAIRYCLDEIRELSKEVYLNTPRK
jgi:transcriptional regulator with XRE-family HTH domain